MAHIISGENMWRKIWWVECSGRGNSAKMNTGFERMDLADEYGIGDAGGRLGPPPQPENEDQILLRLPPKAAEKIHKMLKEEDQDLFSESVAFVQRGDHLGFAIGKERFLSSEKVRLPAVVETYKTYDGTTYYKTADVGEMIVVHDNDRKNKKESLVDGVKASGLTPSMKAIKTRWKKPKVTVDEVRDMESVLLRLLKGQMPDNVRLDVITLEQLEKEVAAGVHLKGTKGGSGGEEEAGKERKRKRDEDGEGDDIRIVKIRKKD